jgi:hypothetical protein
MPRMPATTKVAFTLIACAILLHGGLGFAAGSGSPPPARADARAEPVAAGCDRDDPTASGVGRVSPRPRAQSVPPMRW